MEAFMKTWKHIVLIAIVVITVLSLLLSACGPIDSSNGNSNKEKNTEKDKDNDNQNDADSEDNVTAGKLTICHRTGSARNPYVEITVSVNAATDGHGNHEGDLIPAPEGGCPATAGAPEDNRGNADKITLCHRTGSAMNPYVEITVPADATTDGHGTHEGDLIPAPENGCPSSVIATEATAE
jgi:hypothetical protein